MITRYKKSIGALAMLGAMVAVPMIGAESVQAQTPSYGRVRPVRNITVQGVVRRDLYGNGRFRLRISDGRVIEVLTRTAEPPRLSRGDYVFARGYFSGNVFIANTVRITSNSTDVEETARRGVVTRDFYGRQFQLRADNGNLYLVRTQSAEPVRLSRGDRVEVRGRNDGEVFLARRVTILRNR
jgi:hypothetical protein